MDPIPQLAHMRSQTQRAQLESWLGMQLPFDDEVLEYLLRLSKVVESQELSLLVADFCPHWPEGMQLALAASLSPQALRVPWHGVPGSKQILLEPAPARQENLRNGNYRGPEIEIRPKLKPTLPEATRKDVEPEVITKAEQPPDLQQTIKDIVQEQLALQQRLQRSSCSPKAGASNASNARRSPSPDAEAEKRQKATFRPREQSIQEIINQQLLLQEQLRPRVADGGDQDASLSVKLDLPSETTECKAEREGMELRPVKDLSETCRVGGAWLGSSTELWTRDKRDTTGFSQGEDFQREEPGPVHHRPRQRTRSRPDQSRQHVSTGKMIDVAVKLPDGRTSWQRLPPEVTSLQVKQRLARESGLDVEVFKLAFLGLRLKDHWRLVDCGIKAHDKLQASYVHHVLGQNPGGRVESRTAAGPLPRLEDPSSDVPEAAATDASPTSPMSPDASSVKVEEEPRWTAAVASLQRGIDTLQETMKCSQQTQQENLADCRHSLTMLQQQQQHQLKSLHFIEDQQRSLFAAADSSEMKQGLKQLELEQEELRSRLKHLQVDLSKVSVESAMAPASLERHAFGSAKPSPMQASPSLPSSLPSPARTEHRSWLILQVFRMLDRDRDGLLQQRELMGLAQLMGFNFSQEDWQEEYQALCRDMEIQPHRGFDRGSFAKLLDSEDGCPATDENLFEALINHCPDKDRAAAAVELFERLDLDRDGFLSTAELSHHFGEAVSSEGADHYGRYDLPAFQLLVASLSSEQLRGAPPSPQVMIEVTSPVESSFPSPSAPSSVTVQSASLASPEAAAERRAKLVRSLFVALDADGDGRCSSRELAVVFATRYEAWPMHFRKLCTHWKVKQREGVDAQTFAEMLEDPGELGLYVSEEDLESMISSLERSKRPIERRASRQDRSDLINALFFHLDSNQDGLLDLSELQPLAMALEVDMQDQNFQVSAPLDLDSFRVLVNDGAKCLYCEDGVLPSLLARFSRKG